VNWAIASVRSILRFVGSRNWRPINHWVLGRTGVVLTGGSEMGQRCGNWIWSIFSKLPTRCRILDSTIPYHSNWSSAAFEETTNTIKCLGINSKLSYFSLLFYVLNRHAGTYLYCWKKFGGSNRVSHVAFQSVISFVTRRPERMEWLSHSSQLSEIILGWINEKEILT